MLERLRKDFTILDDTNNKTNTSNIIYFDNACMTLKPKQVVNAINQYYNEFPGCSGRSSHSIAKKVDQKVLFARTEIARLINANPDEILFVRNTTEAINLIARSLDYEQVLISKKEHNSNLIPWLNSKKPVITVNLDNNEEIDYDDVKKKIGKNFLIAVHHISNLDGLETNIKKLAIIAHNNNSRILVDAAQSIPHVKVDVKELDVDFLAFSGHKMLGPTSGVLYVRKSLQKKLKPFLLGGGTVKDSNYKDYILEEFPERFEAGLQDYANIYGLGVAARYLRKLINKIPNHVKKLNITLHDELVKLGAKIIGCQDPKLRNGITSFNLPGFHNHDISLMLDSYNIATRSGTHCVNSWFNAKNIDGAVRVSLYFYNTEEEIDYFIKSLKKIISLKK